MASTPVLQRRHRQREEARRTILDATEAILVDDGYEAFSMRRLAERSGYTPPTIYHHFGDKSGLFDALLEERFSRLLLQLRRAPSHVDPVDTLRDIARAFVCFGLENPTFYRLLMMRRPDGGEPPQSAEASREMMEVPVRALSDAGRLRAGDLEAIYQTIWALTHGVVSLSIHHPDHPWSPNLTEIAIDTLFRGLLADSSNAPTWGSSA